MVPHRPWLELRRFLITQNGTWFSSLHTYIRQWQFKHILGHTVCYDDLKPKFDEDLAMLAYVGNDPWALSNWTSNVAVTQDTISKAPKSKGIWNEIVMKSARSNPSDLVQAVFYYKTKNKMENMSSRRQARKLARLFGKKPVLAMDPFKEHRLFRCSSWTEEADQESKLVDQL